MFRSSYDNLVHTYVCTIYCKKTRAQNEFPQMFDIVRVLLYSAGPKISVWTLFAFLETKKKQPK